jgi:hypothetical protein
MIAKILARVTAVAVAAAITLATTLSLVKGTILLVGIGDIRLRILAACADIVLGTVVLVACLFLATHLAVRILGVGNVEFPPLPKESPAVETPRSDESG